MTDADKVRTLKAAFERFVFDRGGEVLAPTNEWELVRFKTATSTAIIYTKANGQLTFFGGAKSAWDAYLKNRPWSAGNKTKRKRKPASVGIRSLRLRDGDACFYCGLHVCDETASIEHVVPLNAGGTDHIGNKVLAHRKCNSEAGHLSVIDKVKLREAKLKQLEPT